VEAIGPVLILFSLPLIFRLVPPNRFFGLRVPAALRDRSLWYDVNAAHARHLLVLGSVLVLLEFVLPQAVRIWTLRVTATIGLVAVVVNDWRAANRRERERRAGFRAITVNRRLKP
jgi:uncharacterized membrane protein